ncbi:MAG: hypothetical protein V1674_00400 [Candidatus Omnitrophota bacterium]
MKINKFLICVSVITFLCVVYVRQQTEIVRLAYEGKKKSDKLADLLDQKDILTYNVDVLKSLPNIHLTLLSKQDEFEIAREFRVVKLVGYKNSTNKFNGKNLLARLLSLKIPWLERQAEAYSIEKR